MALPSKSSVSHSLHIAHPIELQLLKNEFGIEFLHPMTKRSVSLLCRDISKICSWTDTLEHRDSTEIVAIGILEVHSYG